MHYGTSASQIKLAPVSKFLKELGLGNVETQDSLKITQATLPEETRVVVLKYQQ
jgi:hypothetical protein